MAKPKEVQIEVRLGVPGVAGFTTKVFGGDGRLFYHADHIGRDKDFKTQVQDVLSWAERFAAIDSELTSREAKKKSEPQLGK